MTNEEKESLEEISVAIAALEDKAQIFQAVAQKLDTVENRIDQLDRNIFKFDVKKLFEQKISEIDSIIESLDMYSQNFRSKKSKKSTLYVVLAGIISATFATLFATALFAYADAQQFHPMQLINRILYLIIN
jgi:exonuclease VII small subunit